MSESKKFNTKRAVLISSLIVAVLAACGFSWWLYASGRVTTDDARVKGTIVSVSSRVSARAEQVIVNEGDTVQAGQILAKMDTKELEAQLAQSKANLAAAQAKLAAVKSGSRPQQVAQASAGALQAEANLDNARKNYERMALLYEKGAISAQQLDSAQTALAVAQAQTDSAAQNYSLTEEGSRPEDIQAAAAQVAQAEAATQNAQLVLDNALIKAPANGVIAVRSLDAGENVAVGQPLFTIVDLSDIWVAANIDEGDAGKLAIGQKVEVTIDAYPGKHFSGELIEVGAAANSQFALLPTENTSGNFTKVTQKLPAKIKIQSEPTTVLKPGMSASIAIHI